jgi:hypothetical protein
VYNKEMEKVKFLFNQTCYLPGGRVESGDMQELSKDVAQAYQKNGWGNIYKPRGKKKNESTSK